MHLPNRKPEEMLAPRAALLLMMRSFLPRTCFRLPLSQNQGTFLRLRWVAGNTWPSLFPSIFQPRLVVPAYHTVVGSHLWRTAGSSRALSSMWWVCWLWQKWHLCVSPPFLLDTSPRNCACHGWNKEENPESAEEDAGSVRSSFCPTSYSCAALSKSSIFRSVLKRG